MQKIYARLFLFLSPIILLIVAGEIFLFSRGEVMTLNHAVQMQLEAPQELYYNRQVMPNLINHFKLQHIKRQKPEILILGQSVVLQFRDFMFHPLEDKFYNAGHLINNVYELAAVVKMMESGELHRPKVIIFGLDGGLAKADYFLDWKRSFALPFKEPVYDAHNHISAFKKLIGLPYVLKDRTLPERHPEIGLGIMGQRGFGYRRDGSMHLIKRIQDFIKNPQYEDASDNKQKFTNKEVPLNLPMQYDTSKVRMIIESLESFRRMGIEVVIYNPPNATDFVAYCLRDPAFHILIENFYSLKNQLARRGFAMMPTAIPHHIGLDDRFMLDCSHPGEVMSAIQLLKYLKGEQKTPAYFQNIDISYLENKLLSAQTIPLSFMEEHPEVIADYKNINTAADSRAGMERVAVVLRNHFTPLPTAGITSAMQNLQDSLYHLLR